MQKTTRPGRENPMHSVVISYDDLWPGIEERLLEENAPALAYDRFEPPPDTLDEEP